MEKGTMDFLGAAIKRFATDQAAGKKSPAIFFSAENFFMVAALIFAGSGLFFVIFAGYAWLKQFYVPEVSALFVAGAAYAAAAGLVIIGNIIRHYKRIAVANYSEDSIVAIKKVVESLSKELEDPIRDNPKTALMIAGLAGFTAADRHP